MADFMITFEGEGYIIANQDVASDPKYYGYVMQTGKWYIMEENTANGTFKYATGRSDYTTAWTGRTELDYVQPDALT